MTTSSPVSLQRSRELIARSVRDLRTGRGWTLSDLSKRLGMSTSRLSEIERGGGSFTAEQLLLLMKLFNVPASHFAGPERGEHGARLYNALARLGARHLQESETTPSERLDETHDVIREAILDGSPRVLTALAPVLVGHAADLSPARLQAEMATLGQHARLGWLVENTLFAIDALLHSTPSTPSLASARLRLASLLQRLRAEAERTPSSEDILDATIRSERTLERVRNESSAISKAWNVVTSIQPEDFVTALRDARASV